MSTFNIVSPWSLCPPGCLLIQILSYKTDAFFNSSFDPEKRASIISTNVACKAYAKGSEKENILRARVRAVRDSSFLFAFLRPATQATVRKCKTLSVGYCRKWRIHQRGNWMCESGRSNASFGGYDGFTSFKRSFFNPVETKTAVFALWRRDLSATFSARRYCS